MADQSERKDKKVLHTISDPRSPSIGIVRTPITILVRNSSETGMDSIENSVTYDHENSMQADEDYSKTEESYFTSSEMSSSLNSDSMIEEDKHDEEIVEETDKLASDVEATKVVEQEKINDFIENSEQLKEVPAIKKLKALESLYGACPSYGISVPNKLLDNVLVTPRVCRLPLDSLDNNVIFPSTPPSRYATDSPQYILRQKQWKRIEDEKLKMGIADENGLPPFADVTASAPSKLIKRSKFVGNSDRL